MLALNPESQFALEEDILLQSLPELDHYYAFNVKNGDNFKLNHTAHWILEAIGRGIKYADLLKKFSQNFEINEEAAKQDLMEVIKYALENKIVKEVGS